MPDLNLIDDEGMEETPKPQGKHAAAAPARKGGGGGSSKILLIFLIVIIVLGGGAFVLNKLGIIKLTKKAAPPPTMMDEPFQEPVPDTTQQMVQPPADTTQYTEVPQTTEQQPVQTEQAPAEAKGDVSGMTGAWTVQFTVYLDKKRAETVTQRFVDAGYPAFVHNTKSAGKTAYAVCIGRYESEKAAKAAVGKFAEEIQETHVIRKIGK